MAMSGKEVKEWVAGLNDDDMVAVDDGGLCLVVKDTGSYCEIGGIPLDPNDEEEEGWNMRGGV